MSTVGQPLARLVPLSTRVDRALAESLESIATKHDRTVSAEVRRAIRQYVDRNVRELAA